MSLTAAAIRLLADKGLSALDIAEVAEALESAPACDPVAEKRRAYDRQRKRDQREGVRMSGGNPVDIPQDTSPLNPPLKVSPDPFKKTPPISPQPTTRGARLEDDFTAPAEWISWAMDKRKWDRAEAIDEAECFARYWQAKTGKDAAKRDWFKTWQNWVTNSRRATRQTSPPPSYEFMP